MFIDKTFTLKTDNKRVMHSDNHSTYIAISDMNYEFDGLWSHGFRIFDGFSVNNAKPNGKKEFNPFNFMIKYSKGIQLICTLFKNNQGLLIDCGKNGFKTEFINKERVRSVSYSFNTSSSYKLLKIKNSVAFLKYNEPKRDGFGFDELFVSFSCDPDYNLICTNDSEKSLTFSVVKKKSTNKSPYIYILYNNDQSQLDIFTECNNKRMDVLMQQHINNALLPLKYTGCKTSSKNINKALNYSVLSGSSFIMSKNGQLGIWAGFPWFDNGWGRDTFIALPGIALVTGRYEIASHIIGNFLKYQNTDSSSKDYGKIPNVIFSEHNIKYNTGDGTPLLIRELYEYFLYTGDVSAVMAVWNNVILAMEEVYFKNKDIHNFMPSNDADDWMDARIQGDNPYSPRGNRQVEVQSLWYTALCSLVSIASEIIKRYSEYKPIIQNINIEELKAKKEQYKKAADKLFNSFQKFFITDKAPYIYDHINIDDSPDYKIRPNVLLAVHYNDITGIPRLIDDNALLKSFKMIVNNCIFEHGVSSLSKFDEDFHPYHISTLHHKDAAYHNGSIWGWLSGPFIHCATRLGLQNLAFKQTKNLMNTILYGETPGTISELFEPILNNQTVKSSGAFSQAWSVSEFTRSFYQDYLGIRPDVPQRVLNITPSFPAELGNFNLSIRYGISETINISIKTNSNNTGISFIEIKAQDIIKPLKVIIRLNIGPKNKKPCIDCKVIYLNIQLKATGAQVKVDFDLIDKNRLRLRDLFISDNSELITMGTDSISYCENTTENVSFIKPILKDDISIYKSCSIENYLDKKILGDKFDPIKRFK